MKRSHEQRDKQPMASSLEAKKQAMMVANFNYKGGIGKSTFIGHLPPMLAKFGYNILIVDADPQANSTSFYIENYDPENLEDKRKIDEARRTRHLQNAMNRGDVHQMDEGEDELIEEAQDLEAVQASMAEELIQHQHKLIFPNPVVDDEPDDADPSIMSFFDFQKRSDGKSRNIMDAIQAFRRTRKADDIEVIQVNTQGVGSSSAGKMWLLPGDDSLHALNQMLSQNENLENSDFPDEVWSAFRDMCLSIAASKSVDFVFVDLGPSWDNLNKMIVTSCDFVQVTAFAEWFSWQSVTKLFQKLLPDWMNWQNKFTRQKSMYKKRHPHILPVVCMNYQVNVIQRRPTVSKTNNNYIYAMKLDIEKAFEQKILTGMFIGDHQNPAYVLPLWRHVRGLSISQEMGMPLYDLTRDAVVDYFQQDTKWVSNEFEKLQKDMAITKTRFTSIAKSYEILFRKWKTIL